MDDTRPVKVHKIEILIIDHDNVGAAGITQVIENQRYPNRCISPIIMNVQTQEVEWSDDHPLNSSETADDAYKELFPR